MTYLRSIFQFLVLYLTLAGITAAAIPAGWVALQYVPAVGEEKAYWVLVKEPAEGLDASWSDEELAKIIAGDEDYVQHLETDWSPADHPVADAAEATSLAEELARYWGGDVPQANYWAHGALTRRGETLQAFRWEQDGLTQRTELEDEAQRPRIAAAPRDPNPVDQKYDNGEDVVTYGDRWGDHLRTATLDHVYQAELNKAKRQHSPNPPPAGEVAEATRRTVQACREASLEAEMGVFENYVRRWGGLDAKDVTFGLPQNCVVDPGKLAMLSPPPPPPPPPPPVTPPPPPQLIYRDCHDDPHPTQAQADAVACVPEQQYNACDGSLHDTQAHANAVSCSTGHFKACDQTIHSSQAAADAVRCDAAAGTHPGSTEVIQWSSCVSNDRQFCMYY